LKKKKKLLIVEDIIGVIAALIIFVIPFLFMFVNSLKERRESNLLKLSLPETFRWENYLEVMKTSNGIIFTAFKNSLLISFGSVLVLIIACAMAGYVLQRRKDKVMSTVNAVVMVGLMVPPAILPTIFIMQYLHVYKTLFGMIMVEVSLQIPFTIMLYRGFMSSIPVELEEAGYIDGCTRSKLFTSIVLPLLKPVTATVIILNAVSIFNDFTNPLYFLPGSKNATVQLTLYNFIGQFSSSYSLLFADVIIITIPMLLLFIFFNKKIVEGMTAGAVKG
jgi:raffinose/stachyose/melibiose transport system permease protein